LEIINFIKLISGLKLIIIFLIIKKKILGALLMDCKYNFNIIQSPNVL